MNKSNKPNFFIYGVFKLTSKIISKYIFNLKVVRNELTKKDNSCVIVANHESAIDFIALAGASKHKINFVISNSFYQSLKINPFLKSCGVIPKQQFQTTISDLKKMKKIVDNNQTLAIYPAGMMSEDGKATIIPRSTGKFIKWMDKDVYIAKISGSYLTKPKWSKVNRKGRMELEIYKLYSKDELESLDADSIYNEINEKLYFDAYKEQENRMIKYKHGDNIEGLENVLYRCPKCHKEFTIKLNCKNSLLCEECGYEVTSDQYGFLTSNDKEYDFKYPSEWSSLISKEVEKEIMLDDSYELHSSAKIFMIDYKQHKFKEAGECFVTLNRDEIKFDGFLDNEKFNKNFDIMKFPILPFSPGKYFEFQNGLDIYRIYLEDGREVIKWIEAIKCFYKINNPEV